MLIPRFYLQGVEFWAVNTDAQALEKHEAMNKLQIGTTLTRGLGKLPHFLWSLQGSLFIML